MDRLPPRSTVTHPRFPYTTLFRARLNLARGAHIDIQVTLHGARLPSAEVTQSRDAGWSEKVNKSLRGCLGDRERAISEAAPARSPTRPPIDRQSTRLNSSH